MTTYTVNAITNTTYTNCKNITSVDLQNIPWVNDSMVNGFDYCSNLTAVTNINQNVTNMYASFDRCSKLVNAPEIPNSVTNMHTAFYMCSKLVNAPDMSNANSVTDMSWTFSACFKLSNVSSLPKNVTNIELAFGSCSITTVPVIPDSVTTMYQTFTGCKNLVTVPHISNSVILLTSTFSGCTNLTNIPEIPNSVTIMRETFNGCTNLTGDIYITSENITNTQNCFANTSLDKNVYIPFTYENSEYSATYNSFINAGYSTTSRVNGVLLKDLYQDVDLTGWSYTVVNNTEVVLESYTGSSIDVTVPHLS